jgi:tripartite-type tricarboxylate transporter receptor subunit TctC
MRTRQFLLTLLLAAMGTSAFAQGAAGFPDRPVRIVVPLGAGGLADISFRLVATKLSELLGKPVVVENMPGAGGIAAAQSVMRSKPDGHTLLVVTNGTSTSPSLFKNLPYDPLKDFSPVAFAAYFDLVILANAEGRHKTLGDLLAAARAQPGKLNIATINPGSTQNLSAELFRSVAGIDIAIVPFKSSPEAMNALLADRVDAVFESYASSKGLVDGGKLRALASTGGKRSGYLPAVPSVKEAGVPAYEVVGWQGLAVPVGTPPEIIALLNRHMNTIVAMPDFKKRMLDLGTDAYAGTPEDLRARFTSDVAKWAAVIKQVGIQPQ